MHCIFCGTGVKNSYFYCPSCGVDLFDLEKGALFKNHSRVLRNLTIYSIAIFLVVLSGLFIRQYFEGVLLEYFLSFAIVLISTVYLFKRIKLFKCLYQLNNKVMIYILLGMILVVGALVLNITLHNFFKYFLAYEFDFFSSAEEMTHFKSFSLVLLVAVIPGIIEEIVFRGKVLDELKGIFSQRMCIILSSFVFALLHCNPSSFFYLFIFGILCCFLRFKSNSLIPSTIFHISHNFIILVYFHGY